MPANRTLGALRASVATRLGLASQGVNTGPVSANLSNILFASQTWLYWNFEWRYLRTHVTKTIGASQVYVDFPPEIEPLRVEWVSIKHSDAWSPPLKRGITPDMYTHQTQAAPPNHWDTNRSSGSLQIEFWPETDQSYQYRVAGVVPLGEFSESDHESTLDPDILELHALAVAKKHYGHPDADAMMALAMELIGRQRADAWNKRVFEPDRNIDMSHFHPKPLLVGRDI